MANLPLDEIEKLVGSRYALTVLAGKRARELREGAPRLVNCESRNPIIIALQEILEGKITPEYREPEVTVRVIEDEVLEDLAGEALGLSGNLEEKAAGLAEVAAEELSGLDIAKALLGVLPAEEEAGEAAEEGSPVSEADASPADDEHPPVQEAG